MKRFLRSRSRFSFGVLLGLVILSPRNLEALEPLQLVVPPVPHFQTAAINDEGFLAGLATIGDVLNLVLWLR